MRNWKFCIRKEQLPEGEYLYLVNYYGQLSDSPDIRV